MKLDEIDIDILYRLEDTLYDMGFVTEDEWVVCYLSDHLAEWFIWG